MFTFIKSLTLFVLVGCSFGQKCKQNDLDEFIQCQMRKGKTLGVSAAVIQNETLLWSKAYGYTDGSKNTEVTTDTAFMFASVSKTNIAVATMILFERGWLSVNDDVNDHIPFSVRNPRFPDEPITIHSLLTHSSSIRDGVYDKMSIYMPGDPTFSLHDFLKGYLVEGGFWYNPIKSFNKKNKPLTKFDYSNVGACLAAYVAEVVAQKHNFASDFNDLVRTHIYGPLGANLGKASYFVGDLASAEPPALAAPSPWYGKRTGFRSCDQYAVLDYPTCDWRSTAIDYSKFLSMYINGGTYKGVQILRGDTVDYMKQRSGFADKSGDEEVSNAIFLYENGIVPGMTTLGHDGSDVGVGTIALFNPLTSIGVIIVTNGDFTDRFEKSLYAMVKRLFRDFHPNHLTDFTPEDSSARSNDGGRRKLSGGATSRGRDRDRPQNPCATCTQDPKCGRNKRKKE